MGMCLKLLVIVIYAATLATLQLRQSFPSTMLCWALVLVLHSISGPSVTAAKLPTSLLAFGDSYADTGNHNASEVILRTPWLPPYGQTWPGRPAGRFSDGKVLTDFIAAHLAISSPLPYRAIGESSAKQLEAGINFAFGGSGVFPTFGPQFPNVSSQIGQLEEVIKARTILSKAALTNSLALLVLAGNDYTVFKLLHPAVDEKEMKNFSESVVTQIVVAVRMLYELGIRMFAVTNLEPFGCIPTAAAPSDYTVCNQSQNARSVFHNDLLAAGLKNLQTELAEAQIMVLDLYSSFLSLLGQTKKEGFRLRPCCEKVGDSSCGDVDEAGRPLYKVCSDVEQSFFWDMVHPTQAGWTAVFQDLLPILNSTFSSSLPSP